MKYPGLKFALDSRLFFFLMNDVASYPIVVLWCTGIPFGSMAMMKNSCERNPLPSVELQQPTRADDRLFFFPRCLRLCSLVYLKSCSPLFNRDLLIYFLDFGISGKNYCLYLKSLFALCRDKVLRRRKIKEKHFIRERILDYLTWSPNPHNLTWIWYENTRRSGRIDQLCTLLLSRRPFYFK